MLTMSDTLDRNESRTTSGFGSNGDECRFRYVDDGKPLRVGRFVLQLWVQKRGAFAMS